METDGDEVRLVLLDRTISLSATASDAVKTVLAGGTFTPEQLPGLTDEDRLVVARRLVREGVLVPA
jgi:hypothetical protein